MLRSLKKREREKEWGKGQKEEKGTVGDENLGFIAFEPLFFFVLFFFALLCSTLLILKICMHIE